MNRYNDLLNQYKKLHLNGEVLRNINAKECYPGYQTLSKYFLGVRDVCKNFNVKSVFDYGCGKGIQYSNQIFIKDEYNKRYPSLHDLWGVNQISFWDPGFEQTVYPRGEKFDAVICCDVLEHIDSADIETWVVDTLFNHAKKVLYVTTTSLKAKAILPNNENAHATVRPVIWWENLFKKISSKYEDISYTLIVTEEINGFKKDVVITNHDLSIIPTGGILRTKYSLKIYISRLIKKIKFIIFEKLRNIVRRFS